MESETGLSGAAIIAAIKQAGVTHVAALPDITTSAGLLWPLSRDPDLNLIRLCKEDEGVSVCAGLYNCDRRAVLMIQQTGFFDSINAIRVIAVEYQQPICMVIGLLGKEAGETPTDSARYSVRIVEPILDAMGIDHFCMETTADVARLPAAIDRAYETSRPLAALVGQRLQP
jgi:sulfopyruvate decarboxylase subunit alpha